MSDGRSGRARVARNLALAALSGLLYAASFPGVDAWWLAPLVFAPWCLALRDTSAREAVGAGLATGLVACGIGFRFAWPVLRTFGEIGASGAAIAWVLLVVAESARFVAQAWLTVRLLPRLGAVAASTLAFCASETLVPAPMRWCFSAALHAHPMLLQHAELVGPVLAATPFVACAAWLAELARDRRPRTALFAASSIVATALYGALRLRVLDASLSAEPSFRAALVQPAAPLAWDDVTAARTLATLAELQRDAEARGAALTVGSEAALPMAAYASHPDESVRAQLALLPRTPAILGAIALDDARPPRSFNSALVFDGREVTARYDKRRLLPFSEYVPFGEAFPVLYELSPGSARFRPGELAGTRSVAGHEVGITICYEDALPGPVSDVSAGGAAELLVNLTNDAWFAGSSEPDVHLALAASRAIEHRRYLLHATNDGSSAIVDPAGRVIASAPKGQPAIALGDVRWLRARTLYDLVGEAPAWIVSLCALLLALRPRKSDAE